MYTFPDGTLRPCAARHGRVHGPFTARSRQCIRPCTTAVRHVHTSTPQLKGRVRAKYTSVYTASTQSCTWQVGLHGRVHWPRRHVTSVGRKAPRTRSCRRPIHSRAHVRLHGPCTRPRTRTECRNRPRRPLYRAVYALCRRPKTAVYTSSVRRPKTAVHTAGTLPCTRADTARTRPYTRHVTRPRTAV